MRDGEVPIDTSICTKTPKLDGTAVDLTYINGELVQSLTRGDGHKGNCILRNMKHLASSNLNSDHAPEVVMLTG